MGAARRRQRREARQAAAQLLKAGIAPQHIGQLAQAERMKRVLFKVVDGLEKRLDTGEGTITVREGLAAMKEIRALESYQRELADAEPTDAQLADAEDTLAEAKHEEDVESRESSAPPGRAGDKPWTDVSSASPGLAAGAVKTQPPPLRAAG